MLGLALSGGGFRATLFHIGSLLRINDAALLGRIDEVTSVSGGSIIAAHLGIHWSALKFDNRGVATNFDDIIVEPVRDFCSRTIDVGVILGGILNPIRHPSDLLINNYRKHLFQDKTLQDFPARLTGPRFTIYATSLQTGASVVFSHEYLSEYHLGRLANPHIPVALAVAASSAFPPPLCPVKLRVDPDDWVAGNLSDLHHDRYLKKTLWLADGGIYDNLGLERLNRLCDQVLVSDAGAPFSVDRKGWATRFSQLARTKRTLDIMSERVRALRTRDLIRQFIDNDKQGAYWGIATPISDYPLDAQDLAAALIADSEETRNISAMRTRLNKFDDREQISLINWGYALADAALRSRFDATLTVPASLPFV